MASGLSTAALLRFQNLVLLCKQLRLRVAYKVHEIQGSHADGTVDLTVVVHVLNDSCFKKYLNNCSLSDLLLFRGLLVKMRVELPDASNPGKHKAFKSIQAAAVQQAFLPKFENEGQDTRIADAIVAAADERYMVITIKHSGSLVTLSANGFAAKNSVDNEYTAGGEALLLAHYQRMYGEQAQQKLQALVDDMRQRKLAVSFEMVTGSHGHHGQVPRGEYLMALSAHIEGPTGAPVFLTSDEFSRLCLEFGLPVNDTWLVAGKHFAQKARELLDDMSTQAWTTDKAVKALTDLTSGADAANCVHLPGTYPHAEWQGTRLEGFVIAQGQMVSAELHKQLTSTQQQLSAQVLRVAGLSAELVRPYGTTIERCTAADKAKAVDNCQEEIKKRTSGLVPQTGYSSLDASIRRAVADLLETQQVLPAGEVALTMAGEAPVYSRAALSALDAPALREVLVQAAAQGHATDAAKAAELAAELAKMGASPGRKGAAGEQYQRDMDRMVISAMQVLGGRPTPVDKMLRYKKKMVLWGKDHVGYCCMTFVIRNGLTALGNGDGTYLKYVDSLISNWQLTARDKEQVRQFARCWAAWVKQHSSPERISNKSYLDEAERFVKDFLAGRCMLAPGKSADAFQGIVVCLDCEAPLVEALTKKLMLQNVVNINTGAQYSPTMVKQGTMISVPQSANWPRALRFSFFNKDSVPHVFLVARKPEPAAGNGSQESDGWQQAKKRQGQFQGKIKVVEDELHRVLGSEEARKHTMLLPEQPLTSPNAITSEVDRLAAWLDRGAPLPAPDPSFIGAFITIPGSGKSSIAYGMQPLLMQLLAQKKGATAAGAGIARTSISDSEQPSGSKATQPSGSGTQVAMDFQVLTCDHMKQQKNWSPKSYWPDVAAAAVTHKGGSSSTLVMADRNLVLLPKANLSSVGRTLNSNGATTVAIIPNTQPSPSSAAHLAGDHKLARGPLADYPFPLEFAALCWLRVLHRVGHEGGLDAKLKHALKVMVSFTNCYKDTTLSSLKQELTNHFDYVLELPVMRTMDSQTKERLAPVFAQMAAGLRDAHGFNAEKALPDSWETRMRQLLLQPDVVKALQALQLPLPQITQQLAEMMATAVADGPKEEGAGGGQADAAPSSRKYRYFSVTSKQWLQPVMAAARPLIPTELHPQLKKEELHVTLWHKDDPELGPDEQLRDALAAVEGQSVRLRLLAVYHSPEVSCAEVELLDAPDAAAAHAFHHITLRTAPGVTAKSSNQLPSRMAAGDESVVRLALERPLALEGAIAAA